MAITADDTKQTTVVPTNGSGTTTGGRRFKYGLSVVVLLLATAFILVMANWGAASYARRFDLTAGRAYSLSPQTQAILESLELKCTLTLLFAVNDPNMTESEQAYARSARAQVEDVLREFDQRSSMIEIRRIDPTDHTAAAKIEALYDGLKTSRADLIAKYDKTIEEARTEIAAVNQFLQSELTLSGDQLGLLDQSHQQWRQFRLIQEAVASLPPLLDRLLRDTETVLQPGIGRPLPDWERARSNLASTFDQPASTFTEIARLCRVTESDESLPTPFVATLEPMAVRFTEQAERMMNMRDALADLEAIGLSRLMQQIATENCVLLSDETDTLAIPFNALFPVSVEQSSTGSILDRRFAGERVVSTALRRLTIKEPSTVVICHAEPGNPMRATSQNMASIAAVTEQVRDLGFDVQVWDVLQGEQPEVRSNEFGHPVWVILPPRPNPGAPESAQAGAVLADIAQNLVEGGERVMMNFWPSAMVGFGQPDYWNQVTKSLGVRADSGKQVYQQVPGPNGRSQNEAFVEITDYATETLLGEALNGLETIITAPVPLLLKGEAGFDETADGVVNPADAQEKDTAEFGIKRWVVADIELTKLIWVEENWMQGGAGVQPPGEVATEPVHAIVAVERGLQNGSQRCLIVGSVYWFDDYPVFLSNQAAGGIVFAYPGNAELFTSGVCWLAGIDELIAPSAMTQTVSRITGLGNGAILTYRILLMAVLPLISLGLGIGVWFMRRG